MMKTYFKKASLFLLIVILFLASCKKDKDSSGSTNSRIVTYEITGNFTGKLTIIYNDNVNGNTVVNDVTLPWTKEITYNSNVQGIGIGGNASTMGTPGQTVTLKVYAGSKLIKSFPPVTAGSLGELTLPSFAYTF